MCPFLICRSLKNIINKTAFSSRVWLEAWQARQQGLSHTPKIKVSKQNKARKLFQVQIHTPLVSKVQTPHRHHHVSALYHHSTAPSSDVSMAQREEFDAGGALRRCHTRSLWTSAPRVALLENAFAASSSIVAVQALNRIAQVWVLTALSLSASR